ncbi:MAG: conjugal transfer protein TraB [Gammaproteobacteria bacterium]|nr:conjugal transfer protein TraB [Gammaproteobacteria bacterium]
MSAGNGNSQPPRRTGSAAPDGGARQVRNRQLLLFSAAAAVALLALAAWLSGSGGGPPAPGARITAELAGPDTAEDTWTRRSEARIGRLEADLRDVRNANRQLAEENRRLLEEIRGNADEAKGIIDRLTAALGAAASGQASNEPGLVDPFGGGDVFSPRAARGSSSAALGGSPNQSAAPQGPAAAQPPQGLIERFPLDEPFFREAADEDARQLSVWLPAGSHAEAVVIAGVDASAAVASQGDPRPVLLRITGPAWTAAEDGTAQAVDLHGCTVTGAAYGDLSSEKVYARLRTLTCSGAEPDTVVETEVAGFVAGAGKAGVRGPVVSREGALVQKAFFAGLVSGVGQGVSSAFAPQAVATGTNTAAVANTGLDDIGRAGIGAGASSAGRRVSDYLIRRAEQYQPVIQLQAGTAVTVVFLEGTRLDGRPGDQPTGRTNNDG